MVVELCKSGSRKGRDPCADRFAKPETVCPIPLTPPGCRELPPSAQGGAGACRRAAARGLIELV